MGKKTIIQNLNIAVIGGAKSTLSALKSLRKYKFKNIDIYYYIPKKNINLVEYVNLRNEFEHKDYRYFKFTKITEQEKTIIKKRYDILLSIGLSQLLSQNIINSVKFGCIGFHPTDLPFGKGRSAVAWNILNNQNFRVSFFKIDKYIDTGKVLLKSKWGPKITNPAIYYKRSYNEISKLLIPAIKKLLNNQFIKSNDYKNESFYFLRNYEDGFINFLDKKKKIEKLIQASSYPHPGSYVFYGKNKYLAKLLDYKNVKKKYFAEPGTIIWKNKSNCYLVMTGDFPIFLQINGNFKIGHRFLVLNTSLFFKFLNNKRI